MTKRSPTDSGWWRKAEELAIEDPWHYQGQEEGTKCFSVDFVLEDDAVMLHLHVHQRGLFDCSCPWEQGLKVL